MSPGGRRQRQRLLACVIVSGLMVACHANGEGKPQVIPAPQTPTDPTARDYVGPPLPRAKVMLQDAFGGSQRVEVEVAANDDARQRGMMWRTELAEGQGMLFIFRNTQLNSFWMRNTLIPLDIAFIAEDGRIVGISARAEPRTLSSRSVPTPSKYVLEVPGGWLEKVGVQAGSTVQFIGTSMIPVE